LNLIGPKVPNLHSDRVAPLHSQNVSELILFSTFKIRDPDSANLEIEVPAEYSGKFSRLRRLLAIASLHSS
jgi:hypothetical protein